MWTRFKLNNVKTELQKFARDVCNAASFNMGEIAGTQAMYTSLRHIRDMAKTHLLSQEAKKFRESLNDLIDERVVIPPNYLYDREISKEINEVWLYSPDLEPDTSTNSVYLLVKDNLEKGKKYVFFYEEEKVNEDKLYELSVKLEGSENASFIPMLKEKKNEDQYPKRDRNLLLLFADLKVGLPAETYEELLFEKITERGLYWQQLDIITSRKITLYLKNLRKDSKSIKSAKEILQHTIEAKKISV